MIKNKTLSDNCRIIAAVAVMIFAKLIFRDASLLFDVAVSFLYLVVSYALLCREKPVRKSLPKGYYIFAVSLFILLSTLLSYIFPSDQTAAPSVFSLQSFIVSAVLVPFSEEMFFRRGIIAGSNGALRGILSALIFAFFHTPSSFAPTFFLGIVLAFFYVASGSIFLPFICHFVNNALCLVLIYRDVRLYLLIISFMVSAIYFFASERKNDEQRSSKLN